MEDKIYLIMNKPCGYVCKAESDRHKTVFELLPPELQFYVKNAKRGERLHTVGRLDCNTSGLLLLTTDGIFSHKLTTPQNIIAKKYSVELKNEVTQMLQTNYIERAKKGLLLPAEKKSPEELASSAEIVFSDAKNCTITVTEGKFHEVRRIFLALGNEVVNLKRFAIADLLLNENKNSKDYIAPGAFRNLTNQELSHLMSL